MHQAALLLAACSSAKCNFVVLPEAIWTRSEDHLRQNVSIILGRRNAWLVKMPRSLCAAHPQRCLAGCSVPALPIGL